MTVTIIDGTFWINGVDTGISPEGQPGAPGEDGQDGVGIEDITFTAGEDGTVVTITLTNGTTETFTIPNGTPGTPGTPGADGQDGAVGPAGPAGQDGEDAHWKHEGVQTDMFQAEYVEFDPLEEYWGYSGSVNGAECIVKDTGAVGTVFVDSYPLNSILKQNVGFYVSYQYEKGNTLRFEIMASEATTATLVGCFAIEGDKVSQIGPDGEYSNLIKVNGQSLNYSPMSLGNTFAEYTLGTIQLKEGLNVIEIVVNNSSSAMGGTYKAVSFMTDYIKLTNYGSATFTWSPIYDNLEVVY